ncbi:MAG TPA: class I SAM-dependent methyltransferase [Candidatus Acidoferrum sp.]|nr:class I SAM-dependent methyltransferase [Candidatus Acidoferrum sp.]
MPMNMIQVQADGKQFTLSIGAPPAAPHFPRDMITLLRCNTDAGELTLAEELRADADGVLDAVLRCKTCGADFRIEDGIACLLPAKLSSEASHEMRIRDTIDYDCTNPRPFVPPPDGWRSLLSDLLEVPAHLDELQTSPSSTVLELACGDGRFTTLIAQTGARILAVDFSINALRLLAHRLPPGAHVGRVHADINQLHFASRAFDRALTLTPLISRDERMNMYRTIARALTEDGRYVGSFEHHDLNRRLLGLPLVRRYSRDGILLEHLTTKTLRREVAPYFSKLRVRPIRARVPLFTKLPPALASPLLRLTAVLPFVRHFGELLLLTAQRPVRLPVEGQHRSGSRIAKAVYRFYMGKKNKKASWGEESI